MKKRVVLITKDQALIEPFGKSAERRKVASEVVATPRESFALWQSEEGGALAGVIGDMAMMEQAEKIEILQAHCQPGSPPLILLDLPGVPDPRNPTEFVTRLRWPLAESFLANLQQMPKVPMVFLVDQTLFMTGMMQARLAAIGVPTVPIENHLGIVNMLQDAVAKNLAWAAVVQYKGDVFDAAPLEQQVRAQIPKVRFFLISSASVAHNVERALRKTRPAFMPRDFIEHAADILLGKYLSDAAGRVLYIDNDKNVLIRHVAHLMREGYEVAACLKFDEALEYAQTDSYHIAVVGSALTNAKETALELAKKLREIDTDMRIVLMVDAQSSGGALRGMSEAVEVGLDDCLLKPVEESRLKFSIHRALERRRLIIENKRLVEELAASNEELEQLSGFQQKFFATVAHDIKNPLTAIRGYAEMLSWKVKEATLVKCVTHIQSSTRTLEGLINDLVDFAAIENGKLRINKEDMDLVQVVNDVFSRVSVAAEKRKITMHLNCPEAMPKIQGDPLRIGQVVQNLCTNAVQYTPEGGNAYIKVHPTPNVITVSVRDTGIGISKEDLPRIFQRFFQTEAAQKMRRAGFGLGLKIAQEIVKAHGGGMGVDSEEGTGSVFYFTIPVQPGTEAPVESATVDTSFKTQVAPAPAYPSVLGPHTPMPTKVGQTQPAAPPAPNGPPTQPVPAPPPPAITQPGKTAPISAPPPTPPAPPVGGKTVPLTGSPPPPPGAEGGES